jgi:hypothetical protein
MHIRMTVCASIVAIGTMATMATVFASDHAASQKSSATSAKQAVSAPAPASTRFATLKGIKAAPMEAADLKTIKGLHIHFWTGGAPVGDPHLVNHLENNLGNGQAPAGSGPGYSGLCVANVQSPSIFINPGGGC